jgi:hypothetical protein
VIRARQAAAKAARSATSRPLAANSSANRRGYLLAAAGSMLTAWQLTGQPVHWTKTQTIKVPIQYGSSSGS